MVLHQPGILMRTIKCPECGAPAAAHPAGERFTCEYCGSLVQMDGSRPVLLELAPGAERVRPPPPEATRHATLGAAVSVGLMLCIGVAVVSAYLFSRRSAMPRQVSLGEILSVSLAQTSDPLAASLGVNTFTDDSVYAPLADGPFGYASFSWDDEHPGHVSRVYLGVDGAGALDPSFLDPMGAFWGTHWAPSGEDYLVFEWKGACLMAGVDGSSLQVSADPDEDPDWATRLDLLWGIAGDILTGRSPAISHADRQRWLAGGYTPAELGALSIDTTVDQARDVVLAAFPDARVEKFIDLDLTVPLDHPWARTVKLSWPNEEGGTLESADVWPRSTSGWDDPEAVVACLQAAYGPGDVEVTDHIEGTTRTSWEPDGLTWIVVYRDYLSVHTNGSWGHPTTQAGWERLWEALASCPTPAG